MPTLPVTVTEVEARPGGLYAVRVAYADGSTQVYLIPRTYATVEAVTISALAMAVLADLGRTPGPVVHGPHVRYTPR